MLGMHPLCTGNWRRAKVRAMRPGQPTACFHESEQTKSMAGIPVEAAGGDRGFSFYAQAISTAESSEGEDGILQP